MEMAEKSEGRKEDVGQHSMTTEHHSRPAGASTQYAGETGPCSFRMQQSDQMTPDRQIKTQNVCRRKGNGILGGRRGTGLLEGAPRTPWGGGESLEASDVGLGKADNTPQNLL